MIEYEGTERHPETLGDMQEILFEWKESGITKGAVLYVVDKVWWED